MITSWKEFFTAVEQMRECQRALAKTDSLSARFATEKCEKAVDGVIKKKREEWAQKEQPDIFNNDPRYSRP